MRSKERDVQMRATGWIPALEVATLCKTSLRSVYRWADDGKVERLKVGNSVYIKWTSVRTHLGADVCKALGLDPVVKAKAVA